MVKSGVVYAGISNVNFFLEFISLKEIILFFILRDFLIIVFVEYFKMILVIDI